MQKTTLPGNLSIKVFLSLVILLSSASFSFAEDNSKHQTSINDSGKVLDYNGQVDSFSNTLGGNKEVKRTLTRLNKDVRRTLLGTKLIAPKNKRKLLKELTSINNAINRGDITEKADEIKDSLLKEIHTENDSSVTVDFQ